MLNHRFSGPARVYAAAITAALCIASPAQAASKTPATGPSLAGVGTQISAVHGISITPSLQASDLVIDVAGITSFSTGNMPGNTVLTLDAVVGSTVDWISWNLSITTVGDSWLSEAVVLITNSNGEGLIFLPGLDDDFSGSDTFVYTTSLVEQGISFDVLADGKLYVQFFESYDDNIDSADAVYTVGNITLSGIGLVSSVPEPASYGLMAIGLLGVVTVARRRRTD